MQIDKKKLERQLIGVDAWFDNDCRGTINYATGVGKTYTAILIIKRLFRLLELHNVFILVPSEALQNQWTVEINKHFTKKEFNRIEIHTVNWVLSNNIKIKTNTLIADELHEYYSDENIKAVNGTHIRFDSNLALTATYEDKHKRQLKLEHLYPIVDKLDEQEAIREGYITPFVEFNLGVELTDKERELYIEYTTTISNTINKFGRGGLTLATKCLSGGLDSKGKQFEGSHFVYGWAKHKGWHTNLNMENPQDVQINDIWNPHKVFGYAIKLMNAIRYRKNILYNSNNKAEVCKEIVFKLNDLKAIIFSQSTSFADKLNLMLNMEVPKCSVVYHSKLETILLPSIKTGKLVKFGPVRLKRIAIEGITTGKATKLCTASSLDKGLNIPDITLGITASGTSNFTQGQQRRGRALRNNILNPDKVALLVNLYIKGSQDEKWLKTRQSQTKHKIYWIDSVDEISFNPIDKDVFDVEDI